MVILIYNAIKSQFVTGSGKMNGCTIGWCKNPSLAFQSLMMTAHRKLLDGCYSWYPSQSLSFVFQTKTTKISSGFNLKWVLIIAVWHLVAPSQRLTNPLFLFLTTRLSPELGMHLISRPVIRIKIWTNDVISWMLLSTYSIMNRHVFYLDQMLCPTSCGSDATAVCCAALNHSVSLW